jgi:hypothetical protein
VAKIEGIQLGLRGEEAEALLRELNAIIENDLPVVGTYPAVTRHSREAAGRAAPTATGTAAGTRGM